MRGAQAGKWWINVVKHAASEDDRGQMGLDGSCPRLIAVTAALWRVMPRAGEPNCNRSGFGSGRCQPTPCDLGTFFILSGFHMLFKL